MAKTLLTSRLQQSNEQPTHFVDIQCITGFVAACPLQWCICIFQKIAGILHVPYIKNYYQMLPRHRNDFWRTHVPTPTTIKKVSFDRPLIRFNRALPLGSTCPPETINRPLHSAHSSISDLSKPTGAACKNTCMTVRRKYYRRSITHACQNAGAVIMGPRMIGSFCPD